MTLVLGKVKKSRSRNRRKEARRSFQLPVIHWRQVLLAVLLPVFLVGAAITLILAVDSPIEHVTLEGEFKQVSPAELDSVLRPYVSAGGFLSAKLGGMRLALEALPWVDRVAIRRQWPDGVMVTVTEQVPAALWGKDGLLNSRGELFIRGQDWPTDVLPRLSGPEGSELRVAARLQQMRQLLAPRGLEVVAVNLDARGSWQIRLASGLEVRFGRRSVEERIGRFVDALDVIMSEEFTEMAYIDMRYSHGFAVGRAKSSNQVSKHTDFKADPNV
jgi:cell division protein FtsQ